MVWPTDTLTTTHLDQATDDPSQARAELKSAVDMIKSILGEATAGELLVASDTLIGRRLIDIQAFNTSGTWTRPTGCEAALVIATGGGGGAGGVDSTGLGTLSLLAAGGGGGADTKIKYITSGLNATETVTIGPGGAGGSAAGGNGSGGGTTSFGAHVSAFGGLAAQGVTNMLQSQGPGAEARNSSFTSATEFTLGGQCGHHGSVCAYDNGGITYWTLRGGMGGSSFWGPGGRGGDLGGSGTTANTNAGDTGRSYGSGGGGGVTTNGSGGVAGKDGTKGIVLVFSFSASAATL